MLMIRKVNNDHLLTTVRVRLQVEQAAELTKTFNQFTIGRFGRKTPLFLNKSETLKRKNSWN
jgi:hypothetical protein